MKSTFVFAIFLTAIASIGGSCEDCLHFFKAHQEDKLSEDSLSDQTEVATAIVCPTADDYASCDELVRHYWPTLAQALYPVFMEPERVCSIVRACNYSTEEVTCEECMSWYETLAGNMVEDDSIAERIEFLKGENYCMGEEECVSFIDTYFKDIYEAFAFVMNDRSNLNCCDLSENGICC